MRLVRLTVTRLPGVETPFSLGPLQPHVTVVVGPNASGKSSLVRALRALWLPQLHADKPVDVEAQLRQSSPNGQEVTWHATRVGPTVTWERDGVQVEAPPTPPDHLLDSYLIAIETLMRSGRTDGEIGDLLRREMTGGYDLEAARQATTHRLGGHRSAAREFGAARRELGDLERSRRALHQRRLKRSELEERQQRAAALAAELPRYERAVELRSQLADLAEVRARLADMPAALAGLTGRESEELTDLRGVRAAADERRDRAESQLAEARTALAQTGLAAADLDGVAAHGLQEAAEALADLAEKAERNRAKYAETSASLREPWRRLGGLPKGPTPAAFESHTLDELEEALGERLAAGVQLDAATADVRRLEAELAAAAGADGGRDANLTDAHLTDADLAAAQANLSNWLASPPATPRPRRLLGPAVLLVLAAVLLLVTTLMQLGGGGTGAAGTWLQRVLAAGSGLYVPLAAGILAALAGLVWLLVVATGRPRTVPTPETLAAQRAFERTGAEPLSEWQHEAVAARLERLLAVSAERRVVAARRAAGAVALDGARGRLDGAGRRLAAAEGRLTQLADVAGYGAVDKRTPNAGFAAWLRDVRSINGLTEELRGLSAARAELERQADALYQRLHEGLAGTPFELADPVLEPAGLQSGVWRSSKLPAAAELKAATRRLVKAVTERDQAATATVRAQADLRAAEAAANAAETKRAALLERCGLEADDSAAEAQLHALLAARPGYLEGMAKKTRYETLVADGESQLRLAPQLLEAARTGDVRTLELGMEAARKARTESSELDQQIGELRAEVKLAEESRLLEAARHKVEHAGREVAEHLRRAHLNVATDVLFDEIEQEHSVKRQPAVLKHAQGWFERFTHGAFRLEFDPSAASDERLRARDVASGRRLVPGELSTGTRAQLLLALRVSHAAHAEEGGMKLPFFLDEALTTADAGRFREVAGSLLELSQADARQIVYLSARREDAQAWRSVAEQAGAGRLVSVIDMAEVRDLEPRPEPGAGAVSN